MEYVYYPDDPYSLLCPIIDSNCNVCTNSTVVYLVLYVLTDTTYCTVVYGIYNLL